MLWVKGLDPARPNQGLLQFISAEKGLQLQVSSSSSSSSAAAAAAAAAAGQHHKLLRSAARGADAAGGVGA